MWKLEHDWPRRWKGCAMQKPISLTPPSSFSPTNHWQKFLETLSPPQPNEHPQITHARKMAEAELAKRAKLSAEQRQNRYADDPS
jgi:hypothetical protein